MARPSKRNNDDHILDTQNQVAKAYGVTVRTVRHWVAEGMPRTSDGKYDIKAIQAWKYAQSENKPKKKSDTKSDLETWEAQYRKNKAKIEELKYKKLIGELVSREEVELGLIEISTVLKRSFLSLPKSVAPQLVGLNAREIVDILTDKITDIVEQFSSNEVFKNVSNEEILYDDDDEDEEPPPPKSVTKKAKKKSGRGAAKRRNS